MRFIFARGECMAKKVFVTILAVLCLFVLSTLILAGLTTGGLFSLRGASDATTGTAYETHRILDENVSIMTVSDINENHVTVTIFNNSGYVFVVDNAFIIEYFDGNTWQHKWREVSATSSIDMVYPFQSADFIKDIDIAGVSLSSGLYRIGKEVHGRMYDDVDGFYRLTVKMFAKFYMD